MTHYLVDSNLGSENRMHEINKFLKYTKDKPNSFQLVYGGKKYKQELVKISGLSKYVMELKKTNQAIELPEILIEKTTEYYDQYKTSKYDDPHIYAIISESFCKIVATQDMHICEFYDKKKDIIIKNKPEYFYKNDTLYDSFITKYK